MWGSILGAIGGSIVSGLFGRKSQKRGHQQSKESAAIHRAYMTGEREAAQEFSAKQVAKQMEFQKRMASTQTQRAAADMEKAGLNRILALGQPAAAPMGAAARSVGQSGTPAQQGPNPSGSAAAGAQAGVAAATARENIETMQKQQELLTAQTFKTAQEGRKEGAWADKIETTAIPFTMLQDALGRSGGAAKEFMEILKKLQGSTGGSILDLIKNTKDYGEGLYLEINKAKHRNDRKHNWEDK